MISGSRVPVLLIWDFTIVNNIVNNVICCYNLKVLAQLREEEKLEIEQMNELEAAKELINEASQKMSAAIESKNMQSAKVAQMMLQTGNEKLL